MFSVVWKYSGNKTVILWKRSMQLFQWIMRWKLIQSRLSVYTYLLQDQSSHQGSVQTGSMLMTCHFPYCYHRNQMLRSLGEWQMLWHSCLSMTTGIWEPLSHWCELPSVMFKRIGLLEIQHFQRVAKWATHSKLWGIDKNWRYETDTKMLKKSDPQKLSQVLVYKTQWADFVNAVDFRRGLTCTPGLTNDLIDGGQPRAKPHLRKVKPNHVLKTVFSPRLVTVYEVVG